MSRARGKLYSDDDLEYDEADDEDDGYRQYQAAQKAKSGGGRAPGGKPPPGAKLAAAPKPPPPAAAPPPPPPPPPPSDTFPDAELLDASYDGVAAVLGDDGGDGGGVGEADIVAALRACAYDAEAAVTWLLEGRRAAPRGGLAPAAGAHRPAAPPPALAGRAKQQQQQQQQQQSAPAASASSKPAAATTAAAAAAALPALPPEVEAALACLAAPHAAAAAGGAGASKPRVAVVTCGHVDAGKSTLLGRLLVECGVVAPKALARLARDARAAGKGSFAFAWVLDEGASERARGVTIDVGVNHFDTPSAAYTLLDAPGHRDFVPRTAAGIAQADVAVLVVDATPGEFEKGLHGGGQTREHAQLARALGVLQLVVAVNKMDGPLVRWQAARFGDIKRALAPVLAALGFSLAGGVAFIPLSGLTGQNLALPPGDALVERGLPRPPPPAAAAAGAPPDDSRAAGAGSRGAPDERSGGAATAALEAASAAAVAASEAAAAQAARDAARARELLADMGLDDVDATASDVSHGSGGGGGGGRGDAAAASSTLASAWAPSAEDLQAQASWYRGPTLLGALERARPPPARVDALTRGKPLRLLVSDVFRAQAGGAGAGGGGGGLVAVGRLEGGFLVPQTRVVVVMAPPGGGRDDDGGGGGGAATPQGTPSSATAPAAAAAAATASVRGIRRHGAAVPLALAGDVVEVALGGCDESRVGPGAVLCWPAHPARLVSRFKAQLTTVAPLPGGALVPGQAFTLHALGWEEPAVLTKLLRSVRGGGGGGGEAAAAGEEAACRTLIIKPRLLAGGCSAVVRLRLARPMPLETFADHRRLGRFVLRYDGATVAAGVVLKLGVRLSSPEVRSCRSY